MIKVGLILNMIGVLILGLQPEVTLWDTGTGPKLAWLNTLGWVFLFFGFGLILFVECRKK